MPLYPINPGSVTSVAETVPAEFSIAGTPITGSGTLAITKATQSANKVWAGPVSGAVAQPAFRSLVGADLPQLASEGVALMSLPSTGQVAAMTAKNPHDGLLGFWKCDEASNTTRVDSVGDVGDLAGASTPAAAGKINNGIICDGAQSYVGSGWGTNARLPGSFTLQAWVKFSAAVDVGEFWPVLGRNGNGLAFYYQLELHRTGANTRFRLRGSSAGTSLDLEYNHTSNLSAATWYLLTAVYDQPNATVKLYVDTTAVSVAAGVSAFFDDATASDVFIGNYVGGGDCHDLQVDEAGIWTRPLSLAEIAATYRNGSGASYLQVPDVTPAAVAPFGFVSTGATVTNTITETAILGTITSGSATAGANRFRYNSGVALVVAGTITTAAVPGTLTIRYKWNGTTILTHTFTPTALQSGAWFRLTLTQICLSVGAAGVFFVDSTLGSGNSNRITDGSSSAALDTTVAQALTVTAQWAIADAGNSLAITTTQGTSGAPGGGGV